MLVGNEDASFPRTCVELINIPSQLFPPRLQLLAFLGISSYGAYTPKSSLFKPESRKEANRMPESRRERAKREGRLVRWGTWQTMSFVGPVQKKGPRSIADFHDPH